MKGVIFDFDGTLFNSMNFWDNFFVIYLNQKGKTVSNEEKKIIESFPSLIKACEYMKEKFNISETPAAIEKEILFLIETNYKYNIPLKPYVHAFLNKLKKKNIKMCIATATDKCFIEYALKRHNVYDMFEFIITSSEVGTRKKDSAKIYEEALLKLGTTKEDTVVFEDFYPAILTAKNAGFNVVGVYDELFENDKKQIEEIADKYIKNYNEYII